MEFIIIADYSSSVRANKLKQCLLPFFINVHFEIIYEQPNGPCVQLGHNDHLLAVFIHNNNFIVNGRYQNNGEILRELIINMNVNQEFFQLVPVFRYSGGGDLSNIYGDDCIHQAMNPGNPRRLRAREVARLTARIRRG